MKRIRISLAAILLFSLNAEAGQFYCKAYHLVTVEVMGQFADQPGFPLTSDVLVTIEGEAIPVSKNQVTRYENDRSGGMHRFGLTAVQSRQTKPILDLESVNGQGILSLDSWGVTLDRVPASCAFTAGAFRWPVRRAR